MLLCWVVYEVEFLVVCDVVGVLVGCGVCDVCRCILGLNSVVYVVFSIWCIVILCVYLWFVG